ALGGRCVMRGPKLDTKSPSFAVTPITPPTFHGMPVNAANPDVSKIDNTSPRIVFEGPKSARPSMNFQPASTGDARKSPKSLFAMTGVPFATISSSKSCRISAKCMLGCGPTPSVNGLQMMQCNLGAAVEPHVHSGSADSNRGVAKHRMMLPCAIAHAPRQHRIELDRDASGETDLPTMRVPAQHDAEPRMGRLLIDFGGVRQENRKCVTRDFGCRLFDIVDTVKMRIVDAGQIYALNAALDYDR